MILAFSFANLNKKLLCLSDSSFFWRSIIKQMCHRPWHIFHICYLPHGDRRATNYFWDTILEGHSIGSGVNILDFSGLNAGLSRRLIWIFLWSAGVADDVSLDNALALILSIWGFFWHETYWNNFIIFLTHERYSINWPFVLYSLLICDAGRK